MTVSKTARWLPSTKARQDRCTILSGKSPNGAHQQHSDDGKPYVTLTLLTSTASSDIEKHQLVRNHELRQY